jgi:hypothetical protein
MEAINDRLDLWDDRTIESDETPIVHAANVIFESAEITDMMACAKCVGECKIY